MWAALSRSGLAASPLATSTMAFGTARWGTDETSSRDIFNAYLDAGGNFIDTADVYAGGRCEELLGDFMAVPRSARLGRHCNEVGVAAGHGVHTGGNGARHVRTALEASLRRLRTDYVDLL